MEHEPHPYDDKRQIVHNIIFQELCLEKVELKSKVEYLGIIETLENKGAEAVILDCTVID